MDSDPPDFLFQSIDSDTRPGSLLIPYFHNLYPRERKEKSKGFYPALFQEPPNPLFLCQICALVVKNPKECEFCGKLFCEPCVRNLDSVVFKKFFCVSCEKEGKGRRPSKLLLKLISELKIRCGFYYKGCAEFVNFYDLAKHEMTCQFREVKCANTQFCKKSGMLKDFIESEPNGEMVRPRGYTCSEPCRKLLRFKRSLYMREFQKSLEIYFELLLSQTN